MRRAVRGFTSGTDEYEGAELSQRRTLPFGGDRPVPGAGDLTKPERFTGQWRLDAGGGNPTRELYQFGGQGAPALGEGSFAEPLLSAGRAYLPGVAIFVQPDGLVKSLANPQTLNRYAYALGNPVNYVDPTGHVVWVAIGVGALVGVVAGGVGYVAGSVLSGHPMTVNEGLVAAGVGAGAGAVAPIVATGVVGALALGAVANVAQYGLRHGSNQLDSSSLKQEWNCQAGDGCIEPCLRHGSNVLDSSSLKQERNCQAGDGRIEPCLTQGVNGDGVTGRGLALSAGLGVVGGAIGGPVSRQAVAGMAGSAARRSIAPATDAMGRAVATDAFVRQQARGGTTRSTLGTTVANVDSDRLIARVQPDQDDPPDVSATIVAVPVDRSPSDAAVPGPGPVAPESGWQAPSDAQPIANRIWGVE